MRGGLNGAGIDIWPLEKLRPHPENGTVFGDPEESPVFDEVLGSMRRDGLREPVIVKADGTILSGHLRVACARELKWDRIAVRVWVPFASYLDEVKFLIAANTERRQLTPQQIAFAYRRLKEIPREQGGAKGKRGAPVGNANAAKGTAKNNCGESPTIELKARDEAAKRLGVSTDVARACETVFATDGVPDELKRAVNDGKVAPTTAARAVQAEKKRQGGEIKAPTALVALAEQPPKRAPKDDRTDHEKRIEEQAEKYRKTFAALVDMYRVLDQSLSRLPLASVIGPTEHHEYRGLIRDIALRAWREIEAVDGFTNAGRQMSLAVIDGGKK